MARLRCRRSQKQKCAPDRNFRASGADLPAEVVKLTLRPSLGVMPLAAFLGGAEGTIVSVFSGRFLFWGVDGG